MFFKDEFFSFFEKSFSLCFLEIIKPSDIHGLVGVEDGFNYLTTSGKDMSTASLILSKKLVNAFFGRFSFVTFSQEQVFNKFS